MVWFTAQSSFRHLPFPIVGVRPNTTSASVLPTPPNSSLRSASSAFSRSVSESPLPSHEQDPPMDFDARPYDEAPPYLPDPVGDISEFEGTRDEDLLQMPLTAQADTDVDPLCLAGGIPAAASTSLRHPPAAFASSPLKRKAAGESADDGASTSQICTRPPLRTITAEVRAARHFENTVTHRRGDCAARLFDILNSFADGRFMSCMLPYQRKWTRVRPCEQRNQLVRLQKLPSFSRPMGDADHAEVSTG